MQTRLLGAFMGVLLPLVYVCVCVCVCIYIVPPEMSRAHDDYTVIVDNPILMSCEVTGIPPPQITWTTHGEDVTDVKDDSTFHVLANGALRIDHVTTEDSGMYECVATSVAGNATMAVTLNVQGIFASPCISVYYYHFLSVMSRLKMNPEAIAPKEPWLTQLWALRRQHRPVLTQVLKRLNHFISNCQTVLLILLDYLLIKLRSFLSAYAYRRPTY